MSKPQRGLGRGLDALFRGQQETEGGNPVQMLLLGEIRANPEQPRRFFSDASLTELSESIRAQGVLQPILVRPISGSDEVRFEIVAGERRWRASHLAGQRTIPALIREMSPEQALAIALIENLQREDLNPMEEAVGFRELRDRFGLSQEEIATRVGKSRSAVANMLRLLNLPDEIQEDLRNGQMTQGHARPLLAVEDSAAVLQMRQLILENSPSVRDVESWVNRWEHSGEMPEAGERKKRGPGKGAVQAEEALLDLQEKLCQALAAPVKVSGSGNRGRIIIVFDSAEELDRLAGQFGVQKD